MKKFLLLLLIIPFFVGGADAARQYGISMHGDLKYKKDEPFKYVNPDAPKGGHVKLAVTGTFDSLNPFITKGTPPAGLSLLSLPLVFESLMKRSSDEPFSLYGWVAESIEVAPDRSSITYYLNPLAKWPDGQSITADDIIFSHETLRDKGRPNLRLFYNKVLKTEKIDDRTIRFYFKKEEGKDTFDPEAPLLISLMPVLPKHLLTGKDFEKLGLEPMIGSGPYKIKAVNPGKHIIYEKRQDWWGKDLAVNAGQYNFDQIRYDYYRDPHVSFEAFKAGEYDLRGEDNIAIWHTSYDIPAVKNGQIKRLELIQEQPVGIQAFIFNIRRPFFIDKRVRQAIEYAFDFNWVNKNLFYGAYKRTRSFYQNSELQSQGKPEGAELDLLTSFKGKIAPEAFQESYTLPAYNNAQEMRQAMAIAKGLLKDAGWTINPQGKLVNLKGEIFKFEILLYNPDDEKIALSLVRNLKLLGIQAHVRVVDSAQYENRRMEFDFDMIMGTWGQTNSPGNEQTYYWSSKAADQPGSRNYIGLKDPVIDEMCRRLATAQTRTELVTVGRVIDRLLMTGHYVIPLYYREKAYVAFWDKFGYPDYDPKVGIHLTFLWLKDKTNKK